MGANENMIFMTIKSLNASILAGLLDESLTRLI